MVLVKAGKRSGQESKFYQQAGRPGTPACQAVAGASAGRLFWHFWFI